MGEFYSITANYETWIVQEMHEFGDIGFENFESAKIFRLKQYGFGEKWGATINRKPFLVQLDYFSPF